MEDKPHLVHAESGSVAILYAPRALVTLLSAFIWGTSQPCRDMAKRQHARYPGTLEETFPYEVNMVTTNLRKTIDTRLNALKRRHHRSDGRTTVLFTITDLSVGGTQQQLLEIVRGLEKRRFRIIVLVLLPGGPMEREFRKEPGVRVISLNRLSKHDFTPVYKILRVLRRLRVDVVQPLLTPATFFSLIPALVCRTPVTIVAERWGPGAERVGLGYRVYLKAEDFLTRFADRVVPNSKVGQDYMLRRGIPSSKIKVIYNGISSARLAASEVAIASARERLHVEPGHFVVGMVARFDPVKRQDIFLQSAALVAREMPETRFALVGDGPLRTKMESLAQELGLSSKVVFCGEQRPVGAYLSTFDIAVLTSDTEGCSNAILEAMALGKPVVCNDVGGNKELVRNGETGFLVHPKDTQALANAILLLLRDREKAQEMGAKAKKVALSQFSLRNMVEQYKNLYQETLLQRKCRHNRLATRKATLDLLRICTSATISEESKARASDLLHDTIDWEYFLSLASFHGVAPLVYNSLSSNGFADFVPPGHLNVLEREWYQTLYRNTVLAAETETIIATFGKHGIDAITLKGVMLAESLYGNLAVRPTSDIDILVRTRDLLSARNCLKEADYQTLAQTKSGLDAGHAFHGAPYFKNGASRLFLELHWDLSDSKTVHFPETDMWSRALKNDVNGNRYFTLSHEDNLLFLAYHLTKHDSHLLKYLCDVAELVKKYSRELDWDYVSSSASAWGGDIALYYSLKKAKDILGAPVPEFQLERIKPGAMRRWLLERLMPSEAFVAADKRESLRKETISVVHSLMMKRPRQMASALIRPRRGTRGAIARTCAWTTFVLATNFGSYVGDAVMGLHKRPDSK